MATDSNLDLKTIIDLLKKGRTTDWDFDQDEELQKEHSGLLRTRLEFVCRLQYQKVKLYEMDASEFLSFARQDLQDYSERGGINALSNAKRAIECRIDELLTLFNFKGFSSRHGWKLPYKMQVLQTFEVTAPDILRRHIVKKRNLLEHEYVRPDRQETQDVVEIAELFLKATDEYVERGYVASAEVSETKWFPDYADTTKAQFPYDRIIGFCTEYKLIFDLHNEKLTVKHSESERYTKVTRLRSAPRSRPLVVPIRDCAEEDVRDLMVLLMKKGGK